MSDISEKDISDIQPSSSFQMQQDQEKQTQHTPTQNKRDNEAADPAPTSFLTKKRRRSGQGSSFHKSSFGWNRSGTRFHLIFQNKERGNENGPGFLSPPKCRICQ
ncbi:hypothetical protein P9112_002227 [Eukaryota sp. TZLM1-RC]